LDRVLQITSVVVAVLVAAAQLWGAYEAKYPTKSMHINQFTLSSASNLRGLSESASFSVRDGEKSFDNVVIVNATIHNTGASTIDKTDVREALWVSSTGNADIFAISSFPSGPANAAEVFKWKRVSEKKFAVDENFVLHANELNLAILLDNNNL
jgi:hypothetical protein